MADAADRSEHCGWRGAGCDQTDSERTGTLARRAGPDRLTLLMLFDLVPVPVSHRRSASPLALGALVLAVALSFALGGCATKASRVPKKDLSVLQPGTAREVVVDELGTPASTTTSRAGTTVDVFTFVQGTGKRTKAPRPVEPDQAEATELLLMLEKSGKSPMSYFDGKELTVQVNYDAGLRVKDSVMLKIED